MRHKHNLTKAQLERRKKRRVRTKRERQSVKLILKGFCHVRPAITA